METASIFSCKDLSPKKSLARQILAYTTISILSEKFEPDSQVQMETFTSSEQEYNPLQEMVESVNICSQIWEVVSEEAPQPKIFFAKLLELDANVKTRGDLDLFIDEITKLENDIPDKFRILTELFANEGLSKERVGAIIETITQSEVLLLAQKQPVQPVQSQQKHISGRSKTLRVHGRRAITPIRSRHNNNRNRNNSNNNNNHSHNSKHPSTNSE